MFEYAADYGLIPDLTKYNPKHDTLFTWNGTTSGARLPDGDWISDSREGLTFNDATSAAFAMEMPWPKLDVTTYSWQKVSQLCLLITTACREIEPREPMHSTGLLSFN